MLKNMRFEWDSSKYISASGLQTAMGKRLIDLGIMRIFWILAVVLVI